MSFKGNLRLFQVSFYGVVRKFQGHFREVTWMFLAAMSRSRSDGVTHCARVCVCASPPSFFLAFEARCFNGVTRVF